MAPAGRSRLSIETPRPARGPVTLPDYESPAHPLNQKGLDALHDLPRSHKLETLKARLKAANDHLTEAAADVNDRLHVRVERLEKRKRQRENESSQLSTGADNDELEALKERTHETTSKLDQKVRDIIDARAGLSNMEMALRDLGTNVSNNRGVVPPTQSTIGASQFRSSERRPGNENGDENEDEDAAEADEAPSLSETLKRKLGESNKAYKAASLGERYATHNDYVGFKRLVHDARHPGDNAPPLPHASTWFAEDGQNASFSNHGTQQEDDDDFEVAAENISIKCPLTLTVMRHPVQSTKCPHNFEKQAILEMINVSGTRVGAGTRGNVGERAVKCPVCEILLSKDDLQPNVVLLRKIKRMQEAERRRNEESDNEDDSRGIDRQEVTSSPPPPASALSVKRERMSRIKRDASTIPSTQIDMIDR